MFDSISAWPPVGVWSPWVSTPTESVLREADSVSIGMRNANGTFHVERWAHRTAPCSTWNVPFDGSGSMGDGLKREGRNTRSKRRFSPSPTVALPGSTAPPMEIADRISVQKGPTHSISRSVSGLPYPGEGGPEGAKQGP